MVGILGDEAYGNAIVEEIQNKLERKVNLSAVHITLYRLEDKGFLNSELRGATSSRGGRRKRYFNITNSGLNLLHDIQFQREKLWKLLPRLNFIKI